MSIVLRPNDPFAVEAARSLLSGSVVEGSLGARYRIGPPFTRPGSGFAFLARRIVEGAPDRDVVIVFHPEAASSEALLNAFLREARRLERLTESAPPQPTWVVSLDHGVAPIHGPLGPVALPFGVTEHVDAPTLHDLLTPRRDRGLPATRVRALGGQLALALTSLHQFDLIHGALGPTHVHIVDVGTEQERVKVSGVGGDSFRRIQERLRLPVKNRVVVLGLAGDDLTYAAPELLVAAKRDVHRAGICRQTDIFALACAIFHMLTGAPPFSDEALLARAGRGFEVPMLASHRRRLDEEVQRARGLVDALDRELARAFQREPERRPIGVQDLWAGVAAILERIAARASAGPASRRSPGSRRTPRLSRSQTGSGDKWTWRQLSPPYREGLVDTASFAADGERAYVAGPTGAGVWHRGHFTTLALPAGTTHAVRTVTRAGREVLLLGEAGLVLRVGPGDAVTPWVLGDAAEIRGAHVDERSGLATFVGRRPWHGAPGRTSLGTVLQWIDGSVAFVADVPETPCLRAVVPLGHGRLVACGEAGVLAFVAKGTRPVLHCPTRADLLAGAPIEEGAALIVGEGAWALRVAWREAVAEPVQTQKRLVCAAHDEHGEVLVGAEGARILRRSSSRERLERVTPELGPATVVALWSDPARIRAVCTDGAVLEGRRA